MKFPLLNIDGSKADSIEISDRSLAISFIGVANQEPIPPEG